MTSGWLRISSSNSSMVEKADGDADGNTALQPIDPSTSFSWYDRSWGRLGFPNGNYTWFNLYLDDSELILAAYLIDESPTSASSARTQTYMRSRSIHIRPRRNSSALSIEPVDVFEPDVSPDTVWTSPRSGLLYPQHWELGVEGSGLLNIRSVLRDQEMSGRGQDGEAYLGFVACEGVFDGVPVTGYGGVEVRSWSPVSGDVPGDSWGGGGH
ncbi:Hydroxyneurosporene synthase-domain-containing protein [Aspergillus recurvatus]